MTMSMRILSKKKAALHSSQLLALQYCFSYNLAYLTC